METKAKIVAEERSANMVELGSADMEELGSVNMEELLASIDVSLLDEILAEISEETEVTEEVEEKGVVEVEEEVGGGGPPASCSSSSCTSALHTVVVPITCTQPLVVGWGAGKVDSMDMHNHIHSMSVKNARGIRKITNKKNHMNTKNVLSSKKAMFKKKIDQDDDLGTRSTKQARRGEECRPRVVERSLEELQQQAAAISSSYLRDRGEVEGREAPSSPSHLGGGEGAACRSSHQEGWLCEQCGELVA